MNYLSLILFVGILSKSAMGQTKQLPTMEDAINGTVSGLKSRYSETSSTNDEDAQECVCTPFHLCKSYVSSTDGNNLIDIRVNLAPWCTSYLDVCCNDNNAKPPVEEPKSSTDCVCNESPYTNGHTHTHTPTETTTPIVKEDTTTTTSTTSTESITSTESTTSTTSTTAAIETTKPPHYEHKCGLWNKNGVGFRIVNAIDGEAQYAEYPSMIAIFVEKTSEDGEKKLVFLCGGSLIRDNVILTAAHYVIKLKVEDLVVRGGEWDLHTEKEIYSHQDRRVSKIITHPKYYAGGLHSDIALIYAEEPFHLQENIQTICLPNKHDVFIDDRCFSAGWGKTVSQNKYNIVTKNQTGSKHETGTYQVSILKKVEVPIVSRDKCVESLRSTRLGQKFILHESFICAGGEEGKDTCKGDGGGPLMCPSKDDSNYLVQVGIVAWGINCGLADIPAVYVNVAGFLDWINTEIETYYKSS